MKLIKLLFSRYLKKLLGSLDTHTKNSWSGRKISGFVGVSTAIGVTIFNVKADNAIQFVLSWQTFSLLCLGIITAESLIKLFIETKSNGKVPEV